MRKRHEGNTAVVVGYVRASKESQELTPEAQRVALERWCRDHGAALAVVHEDNLCSVTPVDKRPGLLAALDAVAELGAGVLLVARRDRLARDPILTAMVERLVERTGARVQSAAGEGNGDGPTEQLMRRIVDAFSEYERALIRQRTAAALRVKASRGERTGGVPYGYQLAADGVHLEPHEAEQAIAAAARELREAGMSLRAVGAALEGRGLLPRSGRRWHAETVAGLLAARVAR